MSWLVKIRAERDQMSAIERRIADFILDNAQLLRDYSSQQLANALGISQSSVVKFSQKLGFKGYPDLKFSVGEELARHGSDADSTDGGTAVEESPSDTLWRAKSEAREETDLVNPADELAAAVAALESARRILVLGQGEDGLNAIVFASRLAQLGLPAHAHTDRALALPTLLSMEAGDVLFVLSEFGTQPGLDPLLRSVRASGARVISVTRHTANALRSHADVALLVSAHASEPHIEAMAFRTAMQHLLDGLLLRLWQTLRSRREHFAQIRERLQQPDTF
ncbi:MurR/RpiR family transcriptional regulator [Xanthomonadaceae bacterium JHOS43]|jgi:DNA-binding MurR/RpiR family transcriptional regulator|nr:MurR/RpiR family transcriptional regulator [Xanthomonadaceae bacterium JHOS43]MCX7563232.1 MurR/RpiR family transcriptional regulator [Xanthomonadaceae bacterium XH05]